MSSRFVSPSIASARTSPAAIGSTLGFASSAVGVGIGAIGSGSDLASSSWVNRLGSWSLGLYPMGQDCSMEHRTSLNPIQLTQSGWHRRMPTT